MNIEEEFNSEKMQVANMVKRIREYAKLSQRDLSAMTGITQADISKIERGMGNPSLNTIAKIMSATGNSLQMDYYIPELNTVVETWQERMDPHMVAVVQESADRVREAFGDAVDEVILYGSVARGDNTEDSDVDIAVIVNVEDGRSTFSYSLAEIMADMLDKYKELVNFVCINTQEYIEKRTWYPFYRNIFKEGVSV